MRTIQTNIFTFDELNDEAKQKAIEWYRNATLEDGFRQEWHKGERNLDKLMQAWFETWLEDCQSDAASQLEDDYIIDAIRGNDYEFTADGSRFVMKEK